jgi:ABC-type Co2+ transport system permease subunit
MNLREEGFLGGFLVLGFAIFIAGFLAGLVTAFISVSTEPTMLALIVFIFGFMTGIVTVAILRVIVKTRRSIERS